MIVFRTHRLQVGALGGVCGLFAASGLLASLKDKSRLRKLSRYLGSGYFFTRAVAFARVAFKPAALVLGKEGLVDHVGAPPAGFLPWDMIAKAETLTIPLAFVARKYVAIRLNSADPLEGGRTRSPLEPPLLQNYAALIPEYVLEERVEEVVETVNLYIEDAEEREELRSLLYAPGKPAW